MTQLFSNSSLMQVKTQFLYIAVLFILLFGCISCNKAYAAIRIGWVDQVDLAKIAQVNGAYRKALGESIDWKQYNNEFEMLHDLAVEKLDIAPVGFVALTSAVTAGVQVRIIAIDFQYGNSSGLVIRNASHIDKPEALVGKKIAVTFLTSSHYSLLKALQHWNLKEQDVQLINMPMDKIKDAWKKGEIDGAYVEGINLLRLQKDGHVLVTSKQVAEWGSPTYVFWVVMDNDIPMKPYNLQPFVEVYLQMVKEFNQDKNKLTVNSKDIINIATLLKISPEETLTLLNGNEYLEKREQSLIFARQLPGYFGQTALFLRGQNVLNNVLSDYLIYIYPSFVDNAKIK